LIFQKKIINNLEQRKYLQVIMVVINATLAIGTATRGAAGPLVHGREDKDTVGINLEGHFDFGSVKHL
jgi:hypothetical protein